MPVFRHNPATVKRSIDLQPFLLTLACLVASTAGCSDTSSASGAVEQLECDAEPIIRTTDEGIEFVRTPTGCLEDLPDFPYELKHLDIDGLRQG